MKYIAENNEFPIQLLLVRISASELVLFESCLDYIASNVDRDTIITTIMEENAENEEEEDALGCLETVRDSIRHIIMKFLDKIDLPDKAKDWDYALNEEYGEYWRTTDETCSCPCPAYLKATSARVDSER